MNGRESKITRIVLSNESYKKIIIDKIRKSESIIGTEVFVNNRKYIITNGGIDKKITHSIQELKRKIEYELKLTDK